MATDNKQILRMLINYPKKFRPEPTEEQEKRLYHYAFTSRVIYNLTLDQRNFSRDLNPVPTPLEAWERWEADRKAEVKPERKEMEFEEERNKKVVHKNILTLAEKQ